MTNETNQPERRQFADKADNADPVMKQLKTLYDDVANEPLPDDLMKLLDKLDQVERSR